MPDTTAKIRAKGLDATGVTEDIAQQMYAHKGKHYMAIVEFKVEERHEKADGTKKVDLVLTLVEPAASEDMDEHLRELARTCHYNRGNGDQPTLPTGSDEPTVEGVIAAGKKHRPHPFLPVDASDETPICDVCGTIEATAVHSTQDTLEAGEQGDDEPSETDAETAGQSDEQDAAAGDEEPWEYPAPEGTDTKPVTVPDPFQPAST